MTYEESVEFIDSFTKSGAPVTDLSRFRELCEKLGEPQKKLKFLHIAGTNGKGSVSEYLAVALEKAGYRTGKFTSPFIIDLRERIQLNSVNIPREAFARCCEPVKAASEGCSDYSQFEIFTAVAFEYFVQAAADYVVLETGIGGLNDCTNIVSPALSVITRIDYDHCAVLGSAIPEIAAHKAGIIKRGAPVFVTPFQRPEAIEVLKKTAEQKCSQYVEADGSQLEITKNSVFGTEFKYKGHFFATKMGGSHQPENAAAAIEALRFLNVSEQTIFAALSEASIPARMQVFQKNPLIIVDGGHNESGTAAAAALLKSENIHPIMILGMLSTKEWHGSLKNFLGQAAAVFFVDDYYSAAVPADTLCAFARELGVNAHAAASLEEAISSALPLQSGSGIFIGGSLYLAGAALKLLKKE